MVRQGNQAVLFTYHTYALRVYHYPCKVYFTTLGEGVRHAGATSEEEGKEVCEQKYPETDQCGSWGILTIGVKDRIGDMHNAKGGRALLVLVF